MPEPTLNAVVALRTEISPWLIILRVVPDGWQLPDFAPGQFAVLGLPGATPRCAMAEPEEAPSDPNKLIRRAYSIASSSLTREYMEFYVALVTSGALTPRLFALNIGDRVWLSPRITGMFTLDQVPEGKNVVMIEYANEDHGLAQRRNQQDYQQRILQWFGHYLKGEPAKAWIANGQTVIDRQDEVRKAGRGGRGGS